ncbi:hypothetical protein [Rhodococcus sp. NPDC003348]
MKRIVFAAIAAASVSLLAVGCGSDTDSTDTSADATTAASSSDDFAETAATGDVYVDTCNGVSAYIQTLKESGLTAEENSPEAIGEEFITLAKAEPDWAGKSEQDKADFERGVKAAVAGSC